MSSNALAELSYEDALDRLQKIVKEIQFKDSTNLEKAMTLYKEGRKLSNHCHKLLEKALKEVEDI